MTADLPEHLFANPVWHALQTRHRHFALSAGDACRYPADVVPFAALKSPTLSALHHLHALLLSGESVWVIGETLPPSAELSVEETMDCLQMVLPQDVTPPGPNIEIVPLADAPEMVALTSIAFPGFFRLRTCEMGQYYGVRSHGELIAMGGERLQLEGYSEISGVCTHPAHRGKGYAASLIGHLARKHRRENLTSFLHVGSANQPAVQLYLRMGFQITRRIALNWISR